MARLDVPHALQGIHALRHRQLLGALPGLAAVVRALHGRAVDEVVRRDVERAIARIPSRVEHLPARQERALDLPVAAGIVAPEEEEPPARSYDETRHRGETNACPP